ncbi:ATP-binding protein [Schlegelella sp. S2-27]|uniref:histidine kinase n=1 Tax=Caldimonas mangrovi TaxID=2944811 RepID=A0ABT0YIA2_9BURK|nr:ATP-binding protein [Caldimonas mangrovi]MCM5678459.1 ATP-binding protein [Caldimonas mangrovi]
MKIGTKARLATTTLLATIGLIAAITWWAYREVEQANVQHRQTVEVARRLTELRLVTFEYILRREERAEVQAKSVSMRLAGLLEVAGFRGPEQAEILNALRDRAAGMYGAFSELPRQAASGDHALGETPVQRFEAQLASRLLIDEQESLEDAFRLSDFSTARMRVAQQRVATVTLSGLALIALAGLAVSWLISRNVLRPIQKLQEATRAIAAGNLEYRVDTGRDDEIGEMSKNFDAMTQALRQSFAQLERGNQELTTLNKELEAFSYSVSHDLRAPLRSMDGFSMALLEDYGDKLDEEGRDSLQRIRAASQRMGRLIDELLSLSRVTRTELAIRPVDLSALANEILENLRQQQPQSAVQWRVDEGLTAMADKALIQIALQNLLDNAWKFTGKTAQPEIRVGATERDGQTHYFVADNGVGFDMHYADRLFGAFQRLHHESEFAGTGIGLAIVQRIVHRHGGRIWVEAQPGQGATFFFTLESTNDERR